MKRTVFLVSIIVLLIGTSTVLIFTVPSSNSLKEMTITSDEDLVKLKLPGSGVAEDPYIIELIDFGLKDSNVQGYVSLLLISGTTKEILIRNNKFKGGFISILISSVNEGSITIEDNYFEYDDLCINGLCITSYYAINIYNSSNIIIRDNTFKESNYIGYIYGVYFEESYDLLIENNKISSFYGVYGLFSSNFEVTKNTYYETVDIYFEYCSYFNVTHNTHDYLFRFKVVNSHSVEIALNRIIGYNISFGVIIIDSSYVNVNENVFFENIVAIRLIRSYSSIITMNLFNYGFSHAIELGYETYHNLIFENYFFYNNLAVNPPLQGYDSGSSNSWYDSENQIGNYWTNLGSNATYSIAGSAISSDIFPESI
jgi:hypothetical protein